MVIAPMPRASRRPTSVVLAPFFYCVYLPNMGIKLPNIPSPGDWPDLDFDIKWPDLRMPKVSMPELALLLKLRFPNVNWPQLPDIAFPSGFKLPSVDLNIAFGSLKLKFPHMSWPTLPGGNFHFPDWNGINWADLLAHLELWVQLSELHCLRRLVEAC